MKACPHCTGENPDNAKICEYCGKRFQEVNPKRKVNRLPVILFVVLSILCYVVVLLATSRKEPQLTTSESAWYACRQFVENRLKAPTTAKFEHYNAGKVAAYVNDEWRVTMSVDAENSFGAMIRSDFYCQLRKEGENWYLTSITED